MGKGNAILVIVGRSSYLMFTLARLNLGMLYTVCCKPRLFDHSRKSIFAPLDTARKVQSA